VNANLLFENGGRDPRAARDVVLGEPWVFFEHRTLAEAARDRLAAVNADNRRLCEALTPVVDSFCPGLAAAPYHVHRYGAARPA
jgi:hypothetical protein